MEIWENKNTFSKLETNLEKQEHLEENSEKITTLPKSENLGGLLPLRGGVLFLSPRYLQKNAGRLQKCSQ